MANPLTGAHDAVVQVSVGTLNRLLATMHQNDGTGTSLPTIPHSAFVRVGDEPDARVDGVQGVARVQSGVPRLELLHLSRDRIVASVRIRAWFTAASGSEPFPELVFGTLRAEFGLLEIPGVWPSGHAHGRFPPPRFKFDVDPDTVTFTSFGDTAHDSAIARQIVPLLQTTFSMPSGHPVVAELMDEKLLSLAPDPGHQVVAFALELGPGATGTEVPQDVTNVFTAGQDFAVAASGEFVASLLRPSLDALEATTAIVSVDMFVDTVVYRVEVTSATATWAVDTISSGGTSVQVGALDFRITGTGKTTSISPDGSFTITHRILIGFSPATQSLMLIPKGGASVQVHFAGIGVIESAIESEVAAIYNAQVTAALVAAVPQLEVTTQLKDGLAYQLQVSDDQAGATLESAEFTLDAMVLRGSVQVSPRAWGIGSYDPLPDRSGYNGFLSWFPGGFITKFHWKWQSFPVVPPEPSSPYTQSHDDRFTVRPAVAMPGLPPPTGGAIRGGRVCLDLEGLVIDPISGREVPAVYHDDCISVEAPPPPPWAWPIKVGGIPVLMRVVHAGEAAVVEPGRRVADAACNTLVYRARSARALELLAAVVDGIDRAARDDAGLLVLVAVPEGEIDDELVAVVHAAAPASDVVVRVAEDLGGGWSDRLDVDAGAGDALRLVAPDGTTVWSRDGTVTVDEVAAALQEHLVEAPAPQFVPLRPGARLGDHAPDVALALAPGTRMPLGRLRGAPVTLCFARPSSDSSRAAIRALGDKGATADGWVAVVVADAVDRAAIEVPDGVVVVPDPNRVVTDAFGVYAWPTTVTVDARGLVVSVSTGVRG
jgi:hypothetical protein